MGFKQTQSDLCLNVDFDLKAQIFHVAVCVDDIYLKGKSEGKLKEVKKELSKTFRIKNLVLLHHLSRSKSYSISSYWYHLCGNPTKEHWAAVKE